jgi:hypothetical protein
MVGNRTLTTRLQNVKVNECTLGAAMRSLRGFVGVTLILCCCSTGNTTSGTGDTVQRIQLAVINTCHWLPVADTVLSLAELVTPGTGTLKTIADAICAKVNAAPVPAAIGEITPVRLDNGITVRGSKIEGLSGAQPSPLGMPTGASIRFPAPPLITNPLPGTGPGT